MQLYLGQSQANDGRLASGWLLKLKLKWGTCNKVIIGNDNCVVITSCVFRQVQRLFQNVFSTECDVVLRFSIYNILSFP
jgi:hypothetical protein